MSALIGQEGAACCRNVVRILSKSLSQERDKVAARKVWVYRPSDTNHWHTRSAVTTTSRWVGWSIPSMPSLSYNAARAVCARRVRPYAPDVGHVS